MRAKTVDHARVPRQGAQQRSNMVVTYRGGMQGGAAGLQCMAKLTSGTDRITAGASCAPDNGLLPHGYQPCSTSSAAVDMMEKAKAGNVKYTSRLPDMLRGSRSVALLIMTYFCCNV